MCLSDDFRNCAAILNQPIKLGSIVFCGMDEIAKLTSNQLDFVRNKSAISSLLRIFLIDSTIFSPAIHDILRSTASNNTVNICSFFLVQKYLVTLSMSRWLACWKTRRPRNVVFLKPSSCKSDWRTTIHKRTSVSPALSSTFNLNMNIVLSDFKWSNVDCSRHSCRCALRHWSLVQEANVGGPALRVLNKLSRSLRKQSPTNLIS